MSSIVRVLCRSEYSGSIDLLPASRQKLRVLFLDVRRVSEHHGAEIASCRRAPDRALVPMPDEKR